MAEKVEASKESCEKAYDLVMEYRLLMKAEHIAYLQQFFDSVYSRLPAEGAPRARRRRKPSDSRGEQ